MLVSDRGDIIWLDFDPQTGHEQKGRRPAVVLSPKMYNQKTNLAILCPITSKEKGYPFEVQIKGG
jgi:mRNA interferase MazF